MEALGEMPPEVFPALPETQLLLGDDTDFGSASQYANALLRSPEVVEMLARDARPEHSFLQLIVERPAARGLPICVKKLDPVGLRSIERIRVIAKCKVTVEEFPLRHGVLEGLRVAWGTGTVLGQPALLVATVAAAAEAGRITLHLLPPDTAGH